jgi:hypothetical protein
MSGLADRLNVKMKHACALAVAVAVVSSVTAGATAATAQAAPSAVVVNVAPPTGPVPDGASDVATTWQVKLRGIGAWQHSSCDSWATFPYEYGDSLELAGKDVNPSSPWMEWAFATSRTPTEFVRVENPDYPGEPEDPPAESDPGIPPTMDQRVFSSLLRIDAECTLTRRRDLGLRYWRGTGSRSTCAARPASRQHRKRSATPTSRPRCGTTATGRTTSSHSRSSSSPRLASSTGNYSPGEIPETACLGGSWRRWESNPRPRTHRSEPLQA